MSAIIGVTVGTPTSPQKIEKEIKPVKTVNGVEPDENGNVEVEAGGDTTELENRVENIERDYESINGFYNYMTGLAENPENDGKVYGIKDEEIIPMDLPDSIEINEVSSPEEIPADAKEGSLWVAPKQGGTGENDGDTLTLAKQYTDEQIVKYWTDAEVVDFSTMFDLAQSVMAGGEEVVVSTELATAIHQKMQNGPVKIKVAFNGMTATLFVLAQDFGTHSQFTDFVVLNGELLYLYIYVQPALDGVVSHVSFRVQQVITMPYNPS